VGNKIIQVKLALIYESKYTKDPEALRSRKHTDDRIFFPNAFPVVVLKTSPEIDDERSSTNAEGAPRCSRGLDR
jgi:hypothetical protein